MIRTSNAPHTVDGGIDGAGNTIATGARTLKLDAKVGRGAAEGGAGEFRVPSDLCESGSIGICVGAGHIGSPVSKGLGSVTPEASFLNANSRWVDIITIAS